MLSVFVLAMFAIFAVVFAAPAAEDITPPAIEPIDPTPEDGSTVMVKHVTINVSVTDPSNVSTVLLNWNDENETMSNVAPYIWSFTNTNLENGDYTFKVYANDTAGNMNVSETRIVTVNVTLECGDVAPYPGGNEIVDMGDVIRLLNHVNIPGDFPVDSWAGDCKCTGVIDMGDVILLLNHVNNPDEFPLECCE